MQRILNSYLLFYYNQIGLSQIEAIALYMGQ